MENSNNYDINALRFELEELFLIAFKNKKSDNLISSLEKTVSYLKDTLHFPNASDVIKSTYDKRRNIPLYTKLQLIIIASNNNFKASAPYPLPLFSSEPIKIPTSAVLSCLAIFGNPQLPINSSVSFFTIAKL